VTTENQIVAAEIMCVMLYLDASQKERKKTEATKQMDIQNHDHDTMRTMCYQAKKNALIRM